MTQVCSRNWRIAMWVPWLALAIMFVDVAANYAQLPPRIASHFNAAGVANGWAPKEQFFTVILPIGAVFLALFTFLTSRFPQISGLGWLVMVVEYWGAGVLVGLTHATLRYNLGQASTLDFPFVTWTLIMLGALVIGEIGRIRVVGQQAVQRQGDVIAEYRHSGNGVAVILAGLGAAAVGLPTALGATGLALTIPAVVGVLMVACAVWAYSGFVYRVSTSGVEIRMLGMSIRFIAAADIQSVQAQQCNPLTDFGGWGIRGIGEMRAYIWGGHRCVQIRTDRGERIYLGIDAAHQLAQQIEASLPLKKV
jgi:hypothetical protein